HSGHAAKGYNAANGTLWLTGGQTNNFKQHSTTGSMLASGPYIDNDGWLLKFVRWLREERLTILGALALMGFGLLSVQRLKSN
ncbi:MAG: hypothetical protein RLN85_14630, partial [Pseudomonadales bacterium]